VISKTKIWDESIAPNAINTLDATAVAPLWARCSFSISAGNRCHNRRLTPATLKEAMQHAIAYAVIHELRITIGIQALHFLPGLSYLQWGTGIADSATGFVAAAAPAAAGPPAPAPALGPAPPSLTDNGTAVAHADTAAMLTAPPPTVMAITPPAPSTMRLRMLFNPNSLPADVRTRCNHKQNRRLLTTEIYTAFNCPGDACHNMHCWVDPGLEKTICVDGSISFISRLTRRWS